MIKIVTTKKLWFVYLTKYGEYDPKKLLKTDFFYIPNIKLAKDYLLAETPEYKDIILDLQIASGGFVDVMLINLQYKLDNETITGLFKRHQSPKGINNGQNNDGKIQWARWDAIKELKKNDLYGIQGGLTAELLLDFDLSESFVAQGDIKSPNENT